MDKKLYRPGSGTEGMIFMDKFCHRCIHDGDFNNPCQIILKTMIFDLDDKEYPKEWVLENNQPKCIKFEKIQKPTKGDKNG